MSAVFTVYQTTCLVNGKTYIGCHKTSNPDDSYLGSGVAFSHAVEKYGKENFKKEVLFIFDNPEEMLAKERELVVVDLEKTYNLDRGGWPGFGSRSKESVSASGRKGSEVQRQRYSNTILKEWLEEASKKKDDLWENDEVWRERRYQKLLKMQVQGYQAALSPEARAKRIDTQKLHSHAQGENNSQYGTCWVYTDDSECKIPKEELSAYLEKGFLKGRLPTIRARLKEVSSNKRSLGKIWVSRNKHCKCIDPSLLEGYLMEGWVRGRRS